MKKRKKKIDTLGIILSGNLTRYMNQPHIKRGQTRMRKRLAKFKFWGS
jgi:hypothetical protein